MGARRRSAWTRFRDRGRKRGPRRPAAPGWTIAELEAVAEVTRRTIAEYIRRGLLTAPDFRGTATRYSRQHLVRLLAIRLMKQQGISRIKTIHQRLQSMGDRDVEEWVRSQPLSVEATKALGPAPVAPKTQASQSALPGSQLGAEGWQRVTLLPGLELTWRTDTGPVVQRVVQRLIAYLTAWINESLKSNAPEHPSVTNPNTGDE